MNIETLTQPTMNVPWVPLTYVVNVYKGKEFVVAYRYNGYSGDAMMEEIKELRRTKYKNTEDYWVEW